MSFRPRDIALDEHKPLLQQSAMGIGMGLVQQGVARARQEWASRRNWKVAIEADDDMYLIVHDWLAARKDTVKRRALLAKTHHRHGPMEAIASGEDCTPQPKLRFLIDGEIPQKIVIDGYDITVAVENADGAGRSERAFEVGNQYTKPPRLVFQAATRAGRDAVMRMLLELDAQRSDEKRKPSLMVLSQWGSWQRRSDLPARTMESVIVKGDVLRELHDDLREFKNREVEYVRRGIPYHRAYLLTGPPGTGKSSAVKAITNALGMDLWYAQLSDVDRDTKLLSVIGDVRPQGVLLLEDIDSLSAAVSRESGERDITASGLLNALDGVATPHGLVTILTTNFPENLDSALMRPGRIDRTFTFDLPDADTIGRHVAFFYGLPDPAPGTAAFPLGRSSADVSEVLKRHMDDPNGALEELMGAPCLAR